MPSEVGRWIVSVSRNLCALLAAFGVAVVAHGAVADDIAAFDPLSGSAYAWLADYVGKVNAMPMFSADGGEGETCSAVIVSPLWVLTAGHCVHIKNPAEKPWTSRYFVRMYPLGRLIFMPAPIGRAQFYQIVDFIKSDRFPDPGAATEDWIFLKLHKPLPVDPARIPEVVPSLDDQGGRDIRISGFLRSYDAAGLIDWARSNEPRMSRVSCRVETYDALDYGRMRDLMDIDCIPAVNLGLSGGPLFAIEPGSPTARARIIGIQMGAGLSALTRRQVPVVVRSEQFIAAYRRIIEQDRDANALPSGPPG